MRDPPPSISAHELILEVSPLQISALLLEPEVSTLQISARIPNSFVSILHLYLPRSSSRVPQGGPIDVPQKPRVAHLGTIFA